MPKRDIALMAGFAGFVIAFIVFLNFALPAHAEAAVVGSQTDFSGGTEVINFTSGSPVFYQLGTFVAPTTGNYRVSTAFLMSSSGTGGLGGVYLAISSSTNPTMPTDVNQDAFLFSNNTPNDCTPNSDSSSTPFAERQITCISDAVTNGSESYFIAGHTYGMAIVAETTQGMPATLRLGMAGQPYFVSYTGAPPLTGATSINVTAPTQGTTTPSTTIAINATYNLGADLSSFSLDGSLPTQVGINLTLQNVATNQQINLGTDFDIATSSGSHTYATSTTQVQGDYTLTATLVGDYGFTPPAPGCTPILPFVTCTGTGNIATLATSQPPITFSLANGTFPLLGFQVGDTDSQNGLATTTCDVFNLSGCFQNAIAFLFYPSPGSLAVFQFLWFNIQNKPPFGYVTQTYNALGGLNASSTPAFTFPTLPLISQIFTPLRVGLAALLWLLFGVAFYKRMTNIDL